MAKIGTYPSASDLGGTEELVGVQSAASVKLTPDQLKFYSNKNYGTVKNETGTTYDFVLADGGQLVTFTNVAAIAATIPANSGTAFPIGTRIDVLNMGAGDVTIGITTDTLSSTDNVCAQGKAVTLIKVAATEWWVIGGTA